MGQTMTERRMESQEGNKEGCDVGGVNVLMLPLLFHFLAVFFSFSVPSCISMQELINRSMNWLMIHWFKIRSFSSHLRNFRAVIHFESILYVPYEWINDMMNLIKCLPNISVRYAYSIGAAGSDEWNWSLFAMTSSFVDHAYCKACS